MRELTHAGFVFAFSLLWFGLLSAQVACALSIREANEGLVGFKCCDYKN